jgi:hypothetical protein
LFIDIDYYVYDLGMAQSVNALEMVGVSNGNWCEDDEMGAGRCHNDNSFAVAFSTDNEVWSDYNENFDHREHCNRLHDGCGWTFSDRKVRYVKLRVTSSCSGCTNEDHVSGLFLKPTQGLTSLRDSVAASTALATVTTNNVTLLQNALVATTDELTAAQGTIISLRADLDALTSRLNKLHLSFKQEVKVPDIPSASEQPAGAAQPPASIEATDGGTLTVSVWPGNHIRVTDGAIDDVLLSRREVQDMIQKAVQDALAAAADASE